MSKDHETMLLQLKSRDAQVRFDAMLELAGYPTENVAAELQRLVRYDPDPDVVERALEVLADWGHPSAKALIQETVSKTRLKRVRISALRSAGVVDISPNVESAWAALEGHTWVERAAGAGALARAGVRAALPAIRELASKATKQREPLASHLIGSCALLGDEQSGDQFISILGSGKRGLRRAAVSFLHRGDRAAGMAHLVGLDVLRAAVAQGQKVHEREARRRGTPSDKGPHVREAAAVLERLR